MAKKRRLRAKNRMGVVVPYDIAADDVTMGNGKSAESDIAGIKQAIRMLHATLGNYAFPGGKPDINFDGGGGGGSDTQFAEIAYSLGQKVTAQGAGNLINMYDELTIQLGTNDNLYIIDPSTVRVTMGFVEQQGVYDEETDTIHIAVVTGDIEIEADAMTYFDGGYLALQLDCKNRGSQAGHWIDLIGNIDFALTDVIEKDDGMVFNGSSSKGIAASGSLVAPFDNCTVEIIGTIQPPQSAGDNMPILANNNGGSAAAGFGRTSSRYNCPYFAVAASPLTGVSTNPYNTAFYFDNNIIAVAATKSDVLINGVLMQDPWHHVADDGMKLDVNDYTTGKSDLLSIGYRVHSATPAEKFLNGTIMAIRVYNKKLSVAEMRTNYAIDKKRFNLQ